MSYTKESPGCYHSALRYLSDLTGITVKKELRFDRIEQLRNGKRLAFRSYDITVFDKDGKTHPYMNGSRRFDQDGIEASHFVVKVYRQLEEFGIEINKAGTYKDSLGGGWYSNVPMIKINSEYFAMMECTCF